MRVNRVFFFIVFFLVIGGSWSVAQNSQPKPLEDVLRIIEKQFDIVFTYADKNIQNVFVNLPKEEVSLDKYLTIIENQANLSFKKINSRYIAIQFHQKKITLTGTLIDKTTQMFIIGAIVYAGKHKAVSNSKGRFILKVEPQKELSLIIRHKDYKQVKHKLNATRNKNVKIEIEPKIQVEENKKEQMDEEESDNLFAIPHEFEVNNQVLLPGLSEPDILQNVQLLPGIYSANETVSNINIRGGTNDQSLVLLDEVKLYQTGHFFGLISTFNSHLIENTKVIKSGTSTSYGEGVSGIIELQLQDSLVNQFEAEAGLNMLSADAIVKIPLTEKLSLIAGGRHSINELFETPTYESYYERVFSKTEVIPDTQLNDIVTEESPEFSFYDVSCKLLYDISEKDKLRIGAHKIVDRLKFDESALILGRVFTRKSRLEQSGLLSNIKYTRTWNKKHQTEFSAFLSTYNLEGNNVSLTEFQNHIQLNEVIDWGLKFNSKNKISDQIILKSGYQFEGVTIHNEDNLLVPNYQREGKGELIIHSFYSEGEFSELFGKMNIRAGFRTNYFTEINKLSIEPRFFVDFRLNKQIAIEISGEKKTQHTTQLIDFQSDFLGVDNRRWVLFNGEDTPIITSHQLTIGTKYVLKDFLFAVEGYLKNVDGITSYNQAFQNQYQYDYSIGEYNVQGLELFVSKKLEEANFWFSYALSNNQYYFKEFTISTFPNNYDIRHSLLFGGSYSLGSFEFSTGLKYKTGRPYTKPVQENSRGQEIIYEEPNSSRLNDFIRFDISAKYNFKIKKIKGEFGVSIWNLLDKKNEINVYYQQNENREIEEIKKYALGLTPNVSIRFSF